MNKGLNLLLQVVQGSGQVEEEETRETSRLLNHLTTRKMQKLASVLHLVRRNIVSIIIIIIIIE